MLLGNIDKEQVTTIVLIVAGVIEGILLIALLLNIAKKSKTKKNNMQAMNMFDNSPTGYDYSVQTQPAAYNYDASQTQTYADPNVNTYDATSDNSMSYDANASISPDQSNMVYDNNLVNSSTDTLEAPANPEVMDSGIPSMDYNQETSFDSDNLMEMQKNDTLNVPNSTNYYSSDDTSQTYNASYEANTNMNTGFGSLENLPDIIDVPNADPLPNETELGSDPNEVVEPINNDINLDLNNDVPDMNYDNNDYNSDINNSYVDDSNMGFDNPIPTEDAVPDMNYDDLNNNNFYNEDNNF